MSTYIGDFSGGWKNRLSQELMEDKSVFLCDDLSFDIGGALVCRKLNKEQSYFSSVTATAKVNNVFFVDVEGTGKYLVFYNIGTTLYCWNSATGATRTVSSGMTGGHISYAPMKPVLSSTTYVYYTDGTALGCDNGTTTKTWGIDPPGGVPNVSVGTATGNLGAGDYRYVYTFYDGSTGTESDPSPACAAITVAANGSVNVTNLEVSVSSRVTARKLYRTIADGGTYFLVATITDNVSSEFTDTNTDANLTLELTDDQGLPPSGDIVLAFKNKLLISGDPNYPNRVYFCLTDLPENYPSTFYVLVGTTDDAVQNMVEFAGLVYFVLTAGVYALGGTDENTFTTENTRAHIGTCARWSVAVGPDGVYYLAYDGVYRFDGVKSMRISETIGKSFGKTPTSLCEVVDYDHITNARAAFLNGVYCLLVPFKNTTGTTTNRLLMYDVLGGTWLRAKIDCNFIMADQGRGKLYGAQTKVGVSGQYSVYELMDSASGAGDTPSPQFVTKAFDIREAAEYALTAGGIKAKSKTIQSVSWIRKYRLDAVGDWSVYFYLDGREVYSITLTGVKETDRYKWRNLPSKLKGSYLYVKVVGNGSPRPDSHIFKAIEVR